MTPAQDRDVKSSVNSRSSRLRAPTAAEIRDLGKSIQENTEALVPISEGLSAFDRIEKLISKQNELLEDIAEGIWVCANLLPWEEADVRHLILKWPWTRPSKRKEGT